MNSCLSRLGKNSPPLYKATEDCFSSVLLTDFPGQKYGNVGRELVGLGVLEIKSHQGESTAMIEVRIGLMLIQSATARLVIPFDDFRLIVDPKLDRIRLRTVKGRSVCFRCGPEVAGQQQRLPSPALEALVLSGELELMRALGATCLLFQLDDSVPPDTELVI